MLQGAGLETSTHSSPCKMSNFSQNTSKMRWIQYCTVDVYEFSYFELVMQREWVFEKYILVEISMQDPSWVWFFKSFKRFKNNKSHSFCHGSGDRLWENGFFDFKVEKIVPAYMRIYLCSPLPTDFCRFLLYCLMDTRTWPGWEEDRGIPTIPATVPWAVTWLQSRHYFH